MAADLDHKIRDRAYQLWDQAGQPHGRDQDFWYQAEAELKTAGGLASLHKPATPAPEAPAPQAPAKVEAKKSAAPAKGAAKKPAAKGKSAKAAKAQA